MKEFVHKECWICTIGMPGHQDRKKFEYSKLKSLYHDLNPSQNQPQFGLN